MAPPSINSIDGFEYDQVQEAIPWCTLCWSSDDSHPATKRCLDCDQDMCDIMASSHIRFTLSRNHVLVPVQEIPVVRAGVSVNCSLHTKPLELFDTNCEKLLCVECFIGEHSNHGMSGISAIAPRLRQELLTSVGQCAANSAAIQGAELEIEALLANLAASAHVEGRKLGEEFVEVCF